MDVFSVIIAVVGAGGTIFGIVAVFSGLSARREAHDDRIRAEATEEGKVSTQLSLIQQSMSGLEKGQNYTAGRVDTIEKTVASHTAAIAVLTNSDKQAHHRIDDLRDELHGAKTGPEKEQNL